MANNLFGFWKEKTETKSSDKKAYPKPSKINGKRGRNRHKNSGSPNDRFYLCREWRQLRYLAIKNCEGKCQCCGASAKDGVRIHVDHILPRSKYRHLELCLDNLQVLCDDCNIGKGAWDQTDWRPIID
jgi:5-methylcytosine-specific restriction endonuclease McrA